MFRGGEMDDGADGIGRHGTARPGRTVTLVWLIALAVWSSATAQNFSGTYLGNSDAGPVTVVLNMTGQDLAGNLRAQGIEFVLEGVVQNGLGVGLAFTADGSVGFEAYLEGETLGLYLFEMDANGAPIVGSAIELIMTKQAVAPAAPSAAPSAAANSMPNSAQKSPRSSAPRSTPPPAPTSGAATAEAGPIIATGAYATLTEGNASSFIEALEFVLDEIGYAYTFTAADRAEALRAIAANYASMSQMDQVVLSQASDIWQRVQANWHSISQAEQREFALGVLVLAFGEQTVSAWVGQSDGGGAGMGGGGMGGGSSCTTFEDCTSSLVDEQTWNDTFNAQGCWAAAGCGGFDASTNSFDYETY